MRGRGRTPLNPMFGDWQHRFRFAPIPYGDGGAKRAAFKKAIQAELTNKFFYTGEVRLEVTLHLDIQTVLETSDTADLDNYAKSILDGLKGPDGILLDDTQIQTLIISYIDNYGREGPFFDISITAGPDDFVIKPVSFYEMPDRLWYPESRNVWEGGRSDELPEELLYLCLLMTEAMSSVKARSRHRLREMGFERLVAYKRLLPIGTGIRGFHKSRISSGFQRFDRRTWQKALEEWKATHIDKKKIEETEALLARMKENYERMATALVAYDLSVCIL
jgi:Holliday junction resolvase RusA-like endonuclease